VVEDACEYAGIGQEGEDDHGCGAFWTSEHVDVQNAAQKMSPSKTAGSLMMWRDARAVVLGLPV